MDERGKKYLIKEDREFQTDLGIIKKEQMERATIGDTIITHLNKEFKKGYWNRSCSHWTWFRRQSYRCRYRCRSNCIELRKCCWRKR